MEKRGAHHLHRRTTARSRRRRPPTRRRRCRRHPNAPERVPILPIQRSPVPRRHGTKISTTLHTSLRFANVDRDLHDIDRSKRSGARRGSKRDESIQMEDETSGERAPAIHRRMREEEAAADPKIPARLRGVGAEIRIGIRRGERRSWCMEWGFSRVR